MTCNHALRLAAVVAGAFVVRNALVIGGLAAIAALAFVGA